jgi:prepilin-type N-terminal cleavage/methylation domain-containing protein
MNMLAKFGVRKIRQRGFTLVEVLVATIVLMTGVVAVAQLVPVAVTANNVSRRDSTALVIAQRELAQMMEQPLSVFTFNDALGNACNLGSAAAPGATVGSPVVVIANRPTIDYSVAQVGGYSFTTQPDPQDPYRSQYDVRWAVITDGNGATASSRRIIISARLLGGNRFSLPLTLDAMVQQ